MAQELSHKASTNEIPNTIKKVFDISVSRNVASFIDDKYYHLGFLILLENKKKLSGLLLLQL